MHAKAAQLLEAHSQHILGQLATEQLPATLEREVNAFLDWASQRPIQQVISVERIQDFLTKNKLNFNYAYAYGNSAGDFDMLEYADEPYYVSGEMIEAWEGRNG